MQNRAYTIWQKIIITTIIIVAVLVLAKSSGVQAQITPLLNFAGKVTNVDGSELQDGNYDFNFALYTQATGGAAIWSENLTSATRFSGTIASATTSVDSVTYTYSGESATTTFRIGQYLTNASTTEKVLIIDFNQSSSSVTVASGSPVWSAGQPINNRPYVEGGVVDINFGSVTDLSGLDFNQSLYLEVTFNGEVMQPRKTMIPTAQAFQAERVGDKTEDEIADLTEDETITGEWSFNNIVDISTSSSQTALTVTQNGSGNIAEFKYGATSSLILLADGRVTIGDYTFPASRAGSAAGYVLKVDGVGNMYWANDIAGIGGGSGLWASSSNGLFVYQSDSADIVVLGNNATTTSQSGYQLQVTGGSWLETVALSDQNELRFYDTDSSNYTAIRATGTLSGDYVLTLPDGTGVAGQSLITDGAGMLTWGAPSSFTFVNPGTTGQIGYYAANDSVITATSSIYLANTGNIGIGTTTPSYLFTVDGQSGFSEICMGGTCITDWTGAGSVDSQSVVVGQPAYWFDANTLTSTSSIETVFGGTGRTTWTQYAIPYLTDSRTFGEIGIGTSTYVLAVNASGDGYDWVSASSTGVVLTQEQVDDFTDALINDTDSTHTLITITYDDVDNAMDFVVDSDLSNYNNQTSQFFSTTTDNLAVAYGGTGISAIGTGNILFGSAINTISATSALYIDPSSGWIGISSTTPNQMLSVAGYGDFATGLCIGGACISDWTGAGTLDGSGSNGLPAVWTDSDTLTSTTSIETVYGGTGRTAWTQYAIPYMTDTTSMGEVAIGTGNYVLSVDPSETGYTWVSTSTWDTDSVLTREQVQDYAGSLTASSTGNHSLITITYQDDTEDIDFVVDSNLSNYNNQTSQFFSTTTDNLAVVYGGTGLSSIANQALVYASSDDILSGFTVGNEGEVLAVVGGNLAWATTTSPSAHALLSVSHSDVEATSTLVRGDLMVVNSGTNWSRLGIGANGYILYSDGTDATWSTTTAITALGSITTGTWLANTIDIAYGGTGATTATGARANLDLDEAYKFGINSTGTTGWLWQSDGDGRGQWVATTSLGFDSVSQSKFIGTTTETTNGEIATSTLRGYEAANYICNAEYTGSHYCRTYDILVSIEQNDISTWNGSAWIAEGPPGYTSNSNDCNGWIASSSIMLGAFWSFDSNGGGAGWLTNCSGEKSLACCSR